MQIQIEGMTYRVPEQVAHIAERLNGAGSGDGVLKADELMRATPAEQVSIYEGLVASRGSLRGTLGALAGSAAISIVAVSQFGLMGTIPAVVLSMTGILFGTGEDNSWTTFITTLQTLPAVAKHRGRGPDAPAWDGNGCG